MSEALISELIEKRVIAWADKNEIPLAIRNVSFVPPSEGTYARLFDLPAPTTSSFLDGAHRAYLGVYQVSLVCPVDKGAGPGRTLGMSLSKEFPVNLVLSKGTFKLQIISPVSLGPIIDDTENARSVQPCSFQYRADTVS
jgi:uncharacterized protein DUF4128